MRKIGSVPIFLVVLACAPAWAQDAEVERLLERARRGDAAAEFLLGRQAYEGRGVPRNESQAFRLMERAAKRGHAGAQNALGFYYRHGIGIAADARQALAWFRKAAAQDLPEALYNLAYSLEESGEELEAARAAYAKAAAAGIATAELRLAGMLEKGLGGPADPDEALARYARAGAREQLKRLLALQAAKFDSNGELERAAGYYRRLAALDDQAAVRRLAELLDDEKVPALAPGERRERLRAAALTGAAALTAAAPFQYRYALALEEGRDGPADPVEAHHWYQQAARSGSAAALYRLGLQYDSGSGVSANHRLALQYFSQAAEKGDTRAQERLARLLGPPPDERRSGGEYGGFGRQ